MDAALRLARRGLGAVWPNPAVGCIVVNDGAVAGRGWTQPGGRPHAEAEALRRAGSRARGGTAYVTLEPCAHHGQTPPCAEALIAAGIAACVVACEDPDPRVAGRGLARLRDGGVRVTSGVGQSAAADLNRGFFLRTAEGRPLFTLKMATSLDGRIATASGESRWITGEHARAIAHGLRADHDAVLVGSGTALADDPALDCRLPGMARRAPVRIVADGRLRLLPGAKLVATARTQPTWLLTRPGCDPDRRSAFVDCGVDIIEVEDGADGRLAPAAIARALGGRGLTRVLIEGGARIAASFLEAGLVDRIAWFAAPMLLGGGGVAAVAPLPGVPLTAVPHWRRLVLEAAGADSFALYDRTG